MANKKCLVACAGSGKTTFLVSEVWEQYRNDSVIFVTFTITNQKNISDKIIEKYGFHPSKIKVMGWYEFLFKFFMLPYKADVIPALNGKSISLCFDSDYTKTYTTKDGKTFSKYKKDDKKKKYFTQTWGLHKDLVSEFACECLATNKDSVARRLNESANIICFDESQDFGETDFKIIHLICRNFKGAVLIATDPRQYIYSPSKYHGKNGGKIHQFIANKVNTKRYEYVTIDETSLSYSHRCNAEICKLASLVFPDEPLTQECKCPHCATRRMEYFSIKGVFAVKESDIERFIEQFSPLSLIHSRRETLTLIGKYMTIGDSKGTESDIVLLYPTEDMAKFVFQDRSTLLKPQTKSKLYVSVTRARHCIGIVYRQKYRFSNDLIPFWNNTYIKI